jgi:hypothetical protein
MNIRRDVGRARNEWQFIRIDRSLLRYENKSISSQITAFGRPLCRSSIGECHLTGYLVCTNTLCSIIRSLYAAVSVLMLNLLGFQPMAVDPIIFRHPESKVIIGVHKKTVVRKGLAHPLQIGGVFLFGGGVLCDGLLDDSRVCTVWSRQQSILTTSPS